MMLDVILNHNAIFARRQWLNSLPIMDEPTAELWETVCESPELASLFEVNGHRVVYVRNLRSPLYASENWWIINSDGLPVAYYRDIESVSEFLEA